MLIFRKRLAFQRVRLAIIGSARLSLGPLHTAVVGTPFIWIRESDCIFPTTTSVALYSVTLLSSAISTANGQRYSWLPLTVIYLRQLFAIVVLASAEQCGPRFESLQQCLKYENCYYDTNISKNKYYLLFPQIKNSKNKTVTPQAVLAASAV